MYWNISSIIGTVGGIIGAIGGITGLSTSSFSIYDRLIKKKNTLIFEEFLGNEERLINIFTEDYNKMDLEKVRTLINRIIEFRNYKEFRFITKSKFKKLRKISDKIDKLSYKSGLNIMANYILTNNTKIDKDEEIELYYLINQLEKKYRSFYYSIYSL